MKIQTTNKKLSAAPKKYVRLVLDEQGVERLVEKRGVMELHIVSGKYKEVTPRTFRTLIRNAVRTTKKFKIERLAIEFSKTPFPKLNEYDEAWMGNTIAENLILADYEFLNYKGEEEKKAARFLKEVLLCDGIRKEVREGLRRGEIIAEYTNLCRDIANIPGGDMTPELLGKEAGRVLAGTKATVKVLGVRDIEKLKMGGLLGVGKGAKDKPRFIIIEYYGEKKRRKKKGGERKPLVFVGKGITFDTGGLQVKPGMAMYEMHMDMSGGAAVIAAIGAIAKLGFETDVIGLIPAAENAVSDEAIRPGDVITSMSGKTIDVLHTDAEGRLVLADALHYAKRYKPRLVIDVATLTGAALVAMGQHAHAVMTKDRELEDILRELGEKSGDYVAPLPLWNEYKQYTKGVHGDIANIPENDTRYGGSINGGIFLSHFTEGFRWAHIDMAPRMTSVSSDKMAKGATGEPTRLLVSIAEHF